MPPTALAQQPPPAAQAPEMVQYFMAFLRRGPAWATATTPESIKVARRTARTSIA